MCCNFYTNKTDDFKTSNAEIITVSRVEYEKLQSHCRRVSELESRVAVFIEDLRLARHKQFGVVSENSEENLRKQRSFLLNEAVVFPAAGKTEVKNITVVRLHQYYKKHECIRNNIPECMVISGRRQEGEDLIYPKCGDIITEIGKEVVRILEIIPAQMVVRKDIHFTYDYQTYNNEDIEAPVVKTPREKNIIPGIFATSEVIAHIITYRAP